MCFEAATKPGSDDDCLTAVGRLFLIVVAANRKARVAVLVLVTGGSLKS
jgi:hypothetical protein